MTTRPGGAPFMNRLPKSVTDRYEAEHPEEPKTASRSEPLKRHPEGYQTEDGYVLERCPGNQWNAYERSPIKYPEECVSEGSRSIEEALDSVRQHRENSLK